MLGGQNKTLLSISPGGSLPIAETGYTQKPQSNGLKPFQLPMVVGVEDR